MEYESYFTMVNQDTSTTQCTVHDKTPGSEQRRINIVVRSHYTVGKVINDITTQYRYDSFDLVLQPAIGDLVYLNNLREQLIFDLPGFDASIKNILILLPSGEWDGNVKQRFDLSLQPLKCITNTASLMAAQSVITTTLLEASQATESTATPIDATMAANGGAAPMKQRKHHTSSVAASYETFNTQTTITSTTTTSNINNNNQSIMSSTRTTSNHSSMAGEDGILQTVHQQKRCTVSCVVSSGGGSGGGGGGGGGFGPIGSGRSQSNQQQHNNNNNNANNANNNNNHVINMCIDTATSSTGGVGNASAVGSIDTPDGVGVLMLGGNNTGIMSNNGPSSPSTATNLSATDSLNLSPMSDHEQLTDDDLALGASASPTEAEPMNGSSGGGSGCDIAGSGSCPGALSLAQTSPTGSHDDSTIKGYYDRQYPMSSLSSKSGIGAGKGYVGLVNQAMTCYLNSLLQALYMTPEFRNGLYNWEFDNDNEAKSIPFQLQKLFLNLQTSHKSAIETTDLTRSFGWDSSEAWQQHDIQELCRVMFDALEHKFKRTKQAELISSLYEGKMIDYVKCLECNTEKRREDTFLDIPLPVRPFGNKEAYGSIEEALRAFIQPETLDGNNQYHCEKCNKKCDAHKGLKFKCFPYVLTLHLKRFDFNYQTMHRIKINDKVTFPELLNLNSFVEESQKTAAAGEEGNSADQPDTDQAAANGGGANGVNGSGPTDDCSTTDSGSAMEEDINSVGIATNGSSTGGQHEHEHDMNDDDEGIDMSTSTDHRVNGNSSNGNGSAVADYVKQAKGPYMYELFAIMIHSGSASGGHYFAYIKDFETNEWFCFNDQSVTPITQEDIEKSYGGGSTRSYYTSSYSASINAYMLMYRQVDAKRNERAMKVEDFPAHINTLLPQLRVEDENRITRSSRHTAYGSEIGLPDIIKPRVYFYNNSLRKLKMSRIHVAQSFDINTVLEIAYQNLDVEQFAPLSRCRLVGYDQATETILQSYEHIADPALTEVRAAYDGTMDFLLECHDEGNEFEIYAPGGSTWRVYMVNLVTAEIDGPFFVYSQTRELNNTLRHSISVRLNVKESELLIATLPNLKAFVAYDPLPNKAAQDYLQDVAETYFRHLTYFYLNVPNTDHATLELLGIPSYDGKGLAAALDASNTMNGNADVVDAMLMNGGGGGSSGSSHQQQHGCSLDDSFDNVSMSSNCNRMSNEGIGLNCIRRESPLPLTTGASTPTATQAPSPLPPANINSNESNSEDSSLSDGDRTLVESVQNRGCGVGSSQQSSTSHSPQLSSPEDESTAEDRFRSFYAIVENDSNNVNFQNMHSNRTLFFHAIKTGALDINTLSSSYYSSTDDDVGRKPTHAYKLIVDSHMKVHEFKKHIESLLRVPANYFKLIRKQHDNFVQPNQNHSLLFLNEAETLSVELGKLLQFDEFKAKIFFLNLAELNNDVGKLTNICEWILNSSITAGQAKQELIAKLQRIDAKYLSLTPENCRLWLKSGRNPYKIYNDSDPLAADFRVSLGVEFILQQCEEGVSTQVPADSLTLFVRQWHPDKFELDKFQEITLDKDTDILQALSKVSGIPANEIEYARVNTHFPSTNISLLNVNSSMSWYSIPATPDKYPLTAGATGNVYFYKDSTKDLKDLTTDERRSLNIKEKIRLDRLGCVSSSRFSPRRERALKIYLDSPQSSSSSKSQNAPAQSSPTNGPTASAAEAAAAAAKRLDSLSAYSN